MAFQERFEVEPSTRWMLLAAPWIMLAFALMCAFVPVVPGNEDKPVNQEFLQGFAIVGGVFFSIGAWLCFRIVRCLPSAAITVDEEGIWPTIQSRSTAIVKWNSVVRIRERPGLQRLELIGKSGDVLIRIEYELRKFSRLRSIVLACTQLDKTNSTLGFYQKSRGYHAISIGIMLGFSILGWHVGIEHPLIGYGGTTFLVATIAWEYWTTPYRLSITRGHLEIEKPFRRQIVPREQVARIEVEDEVIKRVKYPMVKVELNDGSKPVHLKYIGLPAVELYQVLHSWHRGDA